MRHHCHLPFQNIGLLYTLLLDRSIEVRVNNPPTIVKIEEGQRSEADPQVARG